MVYSSLNYAFYLRALSCDLIIWAMRLLALAVNTFAIKNLSHIEIVSGD